MYAAVTDRSQQCSVKFLEILGNVVDIKSVEISQGGSFYQESNKCSRSELFHPREPAVTSLPTHHCFFLRHPIGSPWRGPACRTSPKHIYSERRVAVTTFQVDSINWDARQCQHQGCVLILPGRLRIKQTRPAKCCYEPEVVKSLIPCPSPLCLKYSVDCQQRKYILRSQDITLIRWRVSQGSHAPEPQFSHQVLSASLLPQSVPTVSVAPMQPMQPMQPCPEEQPRLRKWAAGTNLFCSPLYTSYLAQHWVLDGGTILIKWINESVSKSLHIYPLLCIREYW